jgi:hypothetical protein
LAFFACVDENKNKETNKNNKNKADNKNNNKMRRAAPQLSRGMLPAYGRSSSSLLASRATLSSTASRAASSLKLKIPFLGDTEIALKDDVFRPGVPENPGNLYAVSPSSLFTPPPASINFAMDRPP